MKKYINEDHKIEGVLTTKDFYDDGMAKVMHIYYDLDTQSVIRTTQKQTAKKYYHLGDVEKKPTVGKTVNAIRKIYDTLRLICKTTAIKTYRGVIPKKKLEECMEKAFVKSVKNPHYKCAPEMCLYSPVVLKVEVES